MSRYGDLGYDEAKMEAKEWKERSIQAQMGHSDIRCQKLHGCQSLEYKSPFNSCQML